MALPQFNMLAGNFVMLYKMNYVKDLYLTFHAQKIQL